MVMEPAIRCGDIQRTYPEVRERAARIAGGLIGLGVRRGEGVALVLRNSVEFVEVSIAAGMAGANPVPVNWHWRGEELRHLLVDSGCRVVVAHSEFVPALEAVLPAGVPLLEVADGVPTGRATELGEWLAGQEPIAEPEPIPALGLVYTSGTTGRPKGVVREKMSLDQILTMAKAVMEQFGLGADSRILVPAPLYHTAPNTVMTLAATLGIDLTILPRFDAEVLLSAVQRHGITQMQLVPTMFVRLLRLPEEVRTAYELSSLRQVLHSAAPCPVQVKHDIIEWFGPIVKEYYGGSETGPAVWCDSAQWLAHPGTVGAPVEGAAIRVVGADGVNLPAGEVGTVYIRPAPWWPDFTYLGDDAKRSAMELDGFLSVGDVGRLDADGYLYLTDRASDMVISGGVNIYPAEIEDALSRLAGVADSAVFGIPDEEFGEALAAHVVPMPGALLTEEQVRDHIRRNLAGFKAPKVVVFTDDLPREESGKLFKRRLRAPYWAHADRTI
jgi:long-chain acyl-CoA synthetase